MSACIWVYLPVFYSVHWHVRPEVLEDHLDPPLDGGSRYLCDAFPQSKVSPTQEGESP